MYTCSGFILIFGKNQYNIVKFKNKIKKITLIQNDQYAIEACLWTACPESQQYLL